uniref:Transmembrane protein 79a n=1 Tax=Monopterus albus TaxID=43700 RepID=A0A3Q3K4A8_MONAL
MSGQGDLMLELIEDVALLSAAPTAEPQIAGNKNLQECNGVEERNKFTEEEEAQEEEVTSSGPVELSTLLWTVDKDKEPKMDISDGDQSENGVSEPEEKNAGLSRGSLDLSEEQSQAESDTKSKVKWRDSMPEGERWRHDERDGSLADDEYEEENEEGREWNWISEKAALGFTPEVTIVHPSSKEFSEESQHFVEKDVAKEPQVEPVSVLQLDSEWTEQDDKYDMCEHLCSEKLRLVLATLAAGLLFPLLVWGGYSLLPFDSPLLESTPLRVVYTLRCSFFATLPILLGVVVQGVARLRYSTLKPLYQNKLVNREVAVHWHYVSESMTLFLFYFLQLAIMATYISQDLVKLVPLLTIVFVFGRYVHFLSQIVSLGSKPGLDI